MSEYLLILNSNDVDWSFCCFIWAFKITFAFPIYLYIFIKMTALWGTEITCSFQSLILVDFFFFLILLFTFLSFILRTRNLFFFNPVVTIHVVGTCLYCTNLNCVTLNKSTPCFTNSSDRMLGWNIRSFWWFDHVQLAGFVSFNNYAHIKEMQNVSQWPQQCFYIKIGIAVAVWWQSFVCFSWFQSLRISSNEAVGIAFGFSFPDSRCTEEARSAKDAINFFSAALNDATFFNRRRI